MVTNKAIQSLGEWVTAVSAGDSARAKGHLRDFYHVGASLLASKEFQAFWSAAQHAPLQPDHLEVACKFLEAVAEVEAGQIQRYGQVSSTS